MSDVPTRLLRDALGETLRETLRETQRDSVAPDPSACLDTDTLAAWSDDALSGRERAAAELHASTCARCQALLAVMVKTQPTAPPRSWWRVPAFKWLVPIALGAAAVVVGINVPALWGDRYATMSPAAPASSVGSATPADRVASTDTRGAAGQPALLPALVPRQPAAAATERRAEPIRPRQSELQGSAPAQFGQQGQQGVPKALRGSEAVPPAGPPPSAPPSAPPRSVATEQEAAIGASPQANAIAPLAATQLFRPSARGTLDAVGSGAPASALARRAPAAAAVPAAILSPNPSVRWRIVAASSVDRSVDGGTTWQTQSTGVPAMLTAGTAPSPAICWIVGPGGTVILSVDGRTWQRAAIPEAVDLTSVSASDAANATVTASDGRTFTTTDGGKTWKR